MWVGVTLETMRVWEEMGSNVMKSFGDGWVREVENVRQRGAEISPQHPKGLIAQLGHRVLKPKVSGQRRQSHAG